MTWRPMSDMPPEYRDGREVLTYNPGNPEAVWPSHRRDRVIVNCWRKGVWWRSSSENPPTHWQPLPAPPGDAEGRG